MMISGCDVLIRLLALDAAGSAEAAEDVPMAWTRIDGCAVRLIAEFLGKRRRLLHAAGELNTLGCVTMRRKPLKTRSDKSIWLL